MSPTKRFGPRYGVKPKKKAAKIEARQRQKHKCRFCGKFAVKRVVAGVFNCTKCKKRFTGKAYWP